MRQFFLCALLAGALLSCNQQKSAEQPTGKDASTTVKDASADNNNGKPMQAEFADAKYTDMGKQMMEQFEAGNIDAYAQHLSDNVVYLWSAGDSLAGKQAVANYWKNRFANTIEKLDLSNDIWLPIKVNTPQRGPDMPGVWLISWHQVNAKYRNGKSINLWTHIDYHFDANDKVDRIIQYIDRAPINAAKW